MDHRVGQPRGFIFRHTADHDRHEQRRRLVFRNASVGHTRDNECNFVTCQRSAVALLQDDVDGTHRFSACRKDSAGSILREHMSQVSQLSPELARGVLQLAQALLAAARTWTLYPPEHPAVALSARRL